MHQLSTTTNLHLPFLLWLKQTDWKHLLPNLFLILPHQSNFQKKMCHQWKHHFHSFPSHSLLYVLELLWSHMQENFLETHLQDSQFVDNTREILKQLGEHLFNPASSLPSRKETPPIGRNGTIPTITSPEISSLGIKGETEFLHWHRVLTLFYLCYILGTSFFISTFWTANPNEQNRLSLFVAIFFRFDFLRLDIRITLRLTCVWTNKTILCRSLFFSWFVQFL